MRRLIILLVTVALLMTVFAGVATAQTTREGNHKGYGFISPDAGSDADGSITEYRVKLKVVFVVE